MTEDQARKTTAIVEAVLPENSGFVLLLKNESDNDIGICGNIHPDNVLVYLKQIVKVMENRKESGEGAMNFHDK